MRPLVLGAVAYDPKVVNIWTGFREWMRRRDFDTDFILYSNYEHQAEDLIAGRIDLAWHSPLAWVRSRRLAAAAGAEVSPLVMRDTDQDLTTVVAVRAGTGLSSLADLRGATVAVGAIDSPQATLLPLSLLRSAGLTPGVDVTIKRFDVGVGLHGDHIGGERDAVTALRDGRVDAACVTDTNLLLFSREGAITSGSTEVIGRTEPYDHCLMTVGAQADQESVARYGELLLSMSYADPQTRPLLDLEGLTRWVPGRTTRFAALERAVDESGLYDATGVIRDDEYRP